MNLGSNKLNHKLIHNKLNDCSRFAFYDNCKRQSVPFETAKNGG